MFSCTADVSARRHSVDRSSGGVVPLALMVSLNFMDLHFLLGFLTCTFRKWNPRLACGTAIKSVRISMSVFGFVPTRDEPAECLPWTR